MKSIVRFVFFAILPAMIVVGCMTGLGTMKSTTYSASYSMSLMKVERPEKATQRYGQQKVDTVAGNPKYQYSFEDDLVKILWVGGARNISFLLENKTDHSIKIPWDEAAFVDEAGRSHRVMHSGIKYTDREQPQPPSIVVRKGTLDDLVFPTDYVYWRAGSTYTAGGWEEKSLIQPDFDFHGTYLTGSYPTYVEFENAAKTNLGKTYQVLLPLQIEDVINDYIFTFKVDNVTAKQDSSSY